MYPWFEYVLTDALACAAIRPIRLRPPQCNGARLRRIAQAVVCAALIADAYFELAAGRSSTAALISTSR